MRPLSELIERTDPAWPLVQQWIAEADVPVEVLPAGRAAGDAALLATQVTTRSPLGAIAHHTAALFIDHGWLRVLAAGRHPRIHRSLPEWNEGRTDRFFLVADDAVGGSFAMNGGSLGDDLGNVYYFAPDTLRWQECGFGYSSFLTWAMSDRIHLFYETLRWDGWRAEVEALSGDRTINVVPPLWAKGPPLAERSRRPVPVAEQYAFQFDMRRQLATG
jgi:hypothetical protein